MFNHCTDNTIITDTVDKYFEDACSYETRRHHKFESTRFKNNQISEMTQRKNSNQKSQTHKDPRIRMPPDPAHHKLALSNKPMSCQLCSTTLKEERRIPVSTSQSARSSPAGAPDSDPTAKNLSFRQLASLNDLIDLRVLI